MTPFERISLDAAATAHHATGAPIAIHLERGNGAFEVVDVLRSLDVPAHAIVLGHLGRNTDLDYITDAGATGAFICIDGPSPGHAATDEALLPVLERVIDAGKVEVLLVGGDTTTRAATTGAGGRGNEWAPPSDAARDHPRLRRRRHSRDLRLQPGTRVAAAQPR